MTTLREPLLHTGITDALWDGHPLAWTSVYCGGADCAEMLHASNNENMRGWVETGRGNFCLPCFAQIEASADDIETYALGHDARRAEVLREAADVLEPQALSQGTGLWVVEELRATAERTEGGR
jgi:hypothetical protein